MNQLHPVGANGGRPATPPPQAVLQKDFVAHTNMLHRDQDFRFSQEYQVCFIGYWLNLFQPKD